MLYLPLSTWTDPQKVQVTIWYTNLRLALRQASKAHPQASACTRRSEKHMCTLSVQASGAFCLDLLALALSLWAVTSPVAYFATQVALATETLSSSSSSRSTQLHGRISTIPTCTTMVFTMVLWSRRRVLQRPLPRPRKPHCTISTVSQCHGMTNVARVTQHYMPLHVLL